MVARQFTKFENILTRPLLNAAEKRSQRVGARHPEQAADSYFLSRATMRSRYARRKVLS